LPSRHPQPFSGSLLPGEEIGVDIEKAKTLIIKYLTTGDPHADGTRVVFFEQNGQPREVVVQDRTLTAKLPARRKAEPGNPKHIAAAMPGLVVRVAVAVGDRTTTGQELFTREAMKMESTDFADHAGRVAEVLVKPGTQVEAGDLLLVME
jgi:pyruvate carboxylase